MNLIHTVAFAGVVLFIGYGLCRLIRPLKQYNVPPPVVGGLLIALIALAARTQGVTLFQFDITLRDPFLIAFFTTIGFGASFSLLKVGGPQVLLFFGAATVFAVLQNVLGVGIATAFKLHPLFGVLTGSVALTGGPATGLAFAPLFEKAGVSGAASIAVAAAMFGIVTSGLVGGPVGTMLIERHKLRRVRERREHHEAPLAEDIVEEKLPEPAVAAPAGEGREAFILLKSLVVVLVAMWAGSWVSQGFASLGFTLPAYLGAMLVAALIRNFDDWTKLIGLSQRSLDDIGHVALSLFLVIALMNLKLWELAGLFLPLLVILAAQLVFVSAVCFWPMFQLMGRDYDSAVMGTGFVGFMMGTMANAMACMTALVELYGRARRAFLVVPMVGAFFIDFTNAVIITLFLNIFG
ncbi:MAG: sodium/glutamate symporter [Candidatus Aminicenantes bacterium]|nr:sodium/glutamate symporter [Candidatus Aminicenantes bacterium]